MRLSLFFALRPATVVLATSLALTFQGSAGAASYRVQPGDTLIGIAARAGVSVASLRAVNPSLQRSDTVQLGRVLQLPPRRVPARMHTVTPGQNLTVIARKYGLSLIALQQANPRFARGPLLAGARLYIPPRTGAPRAGTTPAATVHTASVRVASGTGWLWPVAGHHAVSSGYGDRTLEGQQESHYGIDIVAPEGTLVRAARTGRVLESRPDFARGWGWTVVIKHNDGWITRYAHLSANLVRAGESVVKGQPIGRVGNTGRSTGAHLHFGTYLRWVPHDPLGLY
ncbi:LysM peptidoglycan-binding domain-containing M23 family metallopeptidase [Deinococcus navajonensis]|uniref:LysM peptidoglycan-binding domain-containing M23 family metallopeptidase n=1 Tax=Deinococcus navajonensis TaxID=309884 RepID=A0ABV8XHU0_9DEIO